MGLRRIHARSLDGRLRKSKAWQAHRRNPTRFGYYHSRHVMNLRVEGRARLEATMTAFMSANSK
jgi:hypothetical protein